MLQTQQKCICGMSPSCLVKLNIKVFVQTAANAHLFLKSQLLGLRLVPGSFARDETRFETSLTLARASAQLECRGRGVERREIKAADMSCRKKLPRQFTVDYIYLTKPDRSILYGFKLINVICLSCRLILRVQFAGK